MLGLGTVPAAPPRTQPFCFSLKRLAPHSGDRMHQAGGTLKNITTCPHRSSCFPFPDSGPHFLYTKYFLTVSSVSPNPQLGGCHPSKRCLHFSRSFWELMKKKAFSNSTPKEMKRKGKVGRSRDRKSMPRTCQIKPGLILMPRHISEADRWTDGWGWVGRQH